MMMMMSVDLGRSLIRSHCGCRNRMGLDPHDLGSAPLLLHLPGLLLCRSSDAVDRRSSILARLVVGGMHKL